MFLGVGLNMKKVKSFHHILQEIVDEGKCCGILINLNLIFFHFQYLILIPNSCLSLARQRRKNLQCLLGE